MLAVSYIADIKIINLVGASNNFDMCAFLDSTFICIFFSVEKHEPIFPTVCDYKQFRKTCPTASHEGITSSATIIQLSTAMSLHQ